MTTGPGERAPAPGDRGPGGRIDIINGANLNWLGRREPAVYGHATLETIGARCHERAAGLGYDTRLRQSNHEGTLIDYVQEAGETAVGVIINPGGYTHTSVALRDALAMIAIPRIEVHLSLPEARESFRHASLIRGVMDGAIAGLGASGYVLAVEAIHLKLSAQA